MSKSSVKAARRSATVTALIGNASSLGYAFSGGFEAAVTEAHKLVPSNFLSRTDEQRKAYEPVIRDFGEQFKAGHLLRYLEGRGYEKRLGNQDRAQRITAMIEIMGKPEPTSDKSNRRTDLEHKGVKAAQNAWTRVRTESGLKPQAQPSEGRKAGASKRRAAGDEKAVPVASFTAPVMHAPIDALAFYQRVATELFNATNKNALVVPIELKSAVQDFRKAVREAVAAIKNRKSPQRKASAPRVRKPVAPTAQASNGASA